jgi:hypothetical protein
VPNNSIPVTGLTGLLQGTPIFLQIMGIKGGIQ